jgi:hypothetical protein
MMPELPTHLWILSKLLIFQAHGPVGNPPEMKRLLRYTIATCYKKMNSRLTDPVSDSYIKALTKVEEFSFDPKLQRERGSTEILNDQTFLNYIFDNLAVVKIPIPNITGLYNDYKSRLHQDDANFELYTHDTCTEFHCLLINLLNSFKDSIAEMSTAAESKNYEIFKTNLKTTLSTGYALLTMIKGRAFQMHLQTIEGLLKNIIQSMPTPKKEKDEEDEEEHSEEINEELEAIQQRSDAGPKSLRKIYRDWLQLMVVHFDAVDVLVGYVNGAFPYKSITVKILVPPTLSRELLTIHELLTDKDIPFPKLDSHKPLGPTNEGIDEFISKTRVSLSTAQGKASNAKAALTAWNANKYKVAIRHLKQIVGSEADILVTQATTASQSLPLVKENLNSVAHGIMSLKEALCTESDNLPRLPFKFRKNFLGALHCEACLASMLSPIAKDFTNGDKSYHMIYREMQVGYHPPTFFCHQNLISCDNRVVVKLLEYQNVAAQHAITSSPSSSQTIRSSSHEAFIIPFQHAPYQYGLRRILWIR